MDPGEVVRILVVDDDPDVAVLYKRLLEHRLPVEVERAANAASARRKLSDSSYDLVTVDYRLPDETGISLLEDIAEGEDNPPVIIVTAYGDVHLATRSFELGAAGYVIKDFKLPETLAAQVEKALEQAALKRARDELDKDHAFADVAVNMLDELFFVMDLDGRFLSWNRRLRELTGYSDSELHLMDSGEVFTAGERQRLLDEMRCLSPGEKAVLRTYLVSADGRRLPYELSGVLITDSDGRQVGICAIGQEVSWHRRVRKAEVVSDDLLELTGDIIARVDYDGFFTYLNDVACSFWGLSSEELLGRSFTDLVHPEDMERSVEATSAALRSGKVVYGFVNRQATPVGWRYVEWNASPVRDPDGSCSGFQFTGRDVTEKVTSEKFLLEVNRELDAYAHTVSHDLKGPLSAIMLAADTLRILLEQQDDVPHPNGTLNEMARIISSYTEQAGLLVENLLMLAESGQVPLKVEDVEVSDVVREVVGRLERAIAERGVEVRASGDMGRIRANQIQVTQVFSNLVSNAIIHNDNPDPVVEVKYLGNIDGCHTYEVRDNGPGIALESMEDIFKPFFKGPSGGAGIGLATVEKIVKVYDGSVRARNEGGAVLEFCMKDMNR